MANLPPDEMFKDLMDFEMFCASITNEGLSEIIKNEPDVEQAIGLAAHQMRTLGLPMNKFPNILTLYCIWRDNKTMAK